MVVYKSLGMLVYFFEPGFRDGAQSSGLKQAGSTRQDRQHADLCTLKSCATVFANPSASAQTRPTNSGPPGSTEACCLPPAPGTGIAAHQATRRSPIASLLRS